MQLTETGRTHAGASVASPESERGTVSHAHKRMRVYEQWQGSEVFFCGPHCLLVGGPNWRASFGTAALILVPTGIYLGFVAPFISANVHVVLMVFSVLLPTLSMLFLFMTAFRDPGIIARLEPDLEYLEGRKPRTKDVFVNNQRIVLRYNDTCHIYQPPRAHHCSVNDNCVERFDHHCPWVGTTIGKRNYRSFLLFIYTATILCLYVIACCLTQLFVKHGQVVDDAQVSGDGSSSSLLWLRTAGGVIPALVVAGYCFIFVWFVGGLSVFHAYLISTNQTTYENFRYNHDSRINPYDRGCLMNCFEVWCTPTPPSQVNFTAFLDECPTAAPQQQPQLGRDGGLSTFSLSRNGEDHTHDNHNYNNNIYRNGESGGSSGVSASEVGPIEHGPMRNGPMGHGSMGHAPMGHGAQALGESVELAPTALHQQAVDTHCGSDSCCDAPHHQEAQLQTHEEQQAGRQWQCGRSLVSPADGLRQESQVAAVSLSSLAAVDQVHIDIHALRQPLMCGSINVKEPQQYQYLLNQVAGGLDCV